jgi:hypothetical protein
MFPVRLHMASQAIRRPDVIVVEERDEIGRGLGDPDIPRDTCRRGRVDGDHPHPGVLADQVFDTLDIGDAVVHDEQFPILDRLLLDASE